MGARPTCLKGITWLILFARLLSSAAIPIDPGYEHFYNLEFEQALQEFRKQAAAHPLRPMAFNHIAHAILYREMLRAGALESELVSGSNPFLRRPRMQPSEETAREFDSAIAKAMDLAKSRLEKEQNDLQGLYALGVSYGLRANYNFLVRKAWLDALRDATAARRWHAKASELDPGFLDARLLQGGHDYLVGTLPWHYRLLGFLGGIRGDREKGIHTLETLAASESAVRYDARIILAAIYRREKTPERAIPLLHGLIAKFPRNYLFRLELAQMHADTGERPEALAALDQLERLKRRHEHALDQLPVEKIYFYRGNLLFWFDEYAAALEQLKRVSTRIDEVDLNTGILTWMRIGQIYDLTNRRSEAIAAYRKAAGMAPEAEAAKESRGYMRSAYKR